MRAFVFTLLLAFAFHSNAHDTASWERVHLPDYVSEENESLDDFVLRIAPVLASYTNDTKWEVCSPIGQSEDGRFAVSLISSKASLGCIVYLENLPSGFTYMQLSVHSHPNEKSITPTQMDLNIASFHGRKINQRRVRSQPEGFSPDDFAAGPGYLVTPTQVLFQEGHRTVRRVGRL